MCVGEHVFVVARDVPVCLGGGRRLMLDVFLSLSPLYTEAGSLTSTKSPPMGLLQLSQLAFAFLSSDSLPPKLQEGLHTHLTFSWVLGV